ncbi:MAG: hypothetical protein KAU95_00880 [Candidatus Aenigmarchaeota archaeon]|nr:hypothetical protein [Candidatus Aenigmarchaeota archaeon]
MSEMELAGNLMNAVLCGFLVAFNVVLFLNYFTDIYLTGGSLAWYVIVDLGLIFLVAYPFRMEGMIATTIFLLVLGYAAYGPYAEYLSEPISGIKEGLVELPKLAEHKMHCFSLALTNPMAYQTECVLPDQRKGEEEKPENQGLEINSFGMPTREIYPGMPLQMNLVLENYGDYPAENVEIKTTTGEYDKCGDLPILRDIKPENGTEKLNKSIPMETRWPHYVKGWVEDPWEGNCTYAKNKMVIGGDIKTIYSYEYKTESHLENINIIKNVAETRTDFQVESAKEKAAPATILMYTFVPLIWEKEGGFSETTVPISLSNKRKRGKVIFKGQYKYDWLTATEDNATEWNKEWTLVSEKSYKHCVNSTNTTKKLSTCKKEVEGETVTIKTDTEEKCLECGGVGVYRWQGKKTGNSTYDKITIKPIGEAANYITLSCDGKPSDEGKVVACSCSGNICELIYVGGWGNLEIKSNKQELLYSGLTITLDGGEWPKPDAVKMSFMLYADATYTFESSNNKHIQIKNPHYEPLE